MIISCKPWPSTDLRVVSIEYLRPMWHAMRGRSFCHRTPGLVPFLTFNVNALSSEKQSNLLPMWCYTKSLSYYWISTYYITLIFAIVLMFPIAPVTGVACEKGTLPPSDPWYRSYALLEKTIFLSFCLFPGLCILNTKHYFLRFTSH